MATAGSIVIDLVMRTGMFETDTKRAEKRLREMTKAAKDAGKVLGTAIVAGATAAAVALKSTINGMDEMSKSAQKIGVSTEELSKLSYAAQLADVDLATLTKSLGKLTQAQADALNETSEQSKVFKALGIDVLDATGKMRDSTDVLADFADAFAALGGSPEAQAAGFAIFGRSFQNLVPLIKDGSGAIREAGAELEAFGGVLSTEAGQNAEQFNDDLTRLEVGARSLGIAVASDLLPDLNLLTGEMVEGAKQGEHMKEVAGDIADGFRTLGTAAALVAKTIGTISATARGVTSDLIALYNVAEGAKKFTIFGGFTGFFGGAEEDFRQAGVAREMAAEQSQRIGDIWSPADIGRGGPTPVFAGSGAEPADFFKKSGGQVAAEKRVAEMEKALQEALANRPETKDPKPKKEGKSDAVKEAEELQRAYDTAMLSLTEQIELTGKSTEAARAYFEVTQGGLKDLAPAEKELYLARAADLDVARQRQEEMEKEAEARERQAQSVSDLLEDIAFESELLGKSAEEQEILNNLRWAGVDANDAYGQSIIEATKALQEQREIVGDQVEAMDGLRDSARGFLDDLRAGEGVWDSLKNAADNFADVLWEIVTNNLIEQIFGQQGTTGAGSSGGDWISNLFGSFFGGGGSSTSAGPFAGESAGTLADLFSGSFMGGMAGGGSAMAGHAYLVGERGPEMFVPRTAGTVIPADQTARAMGGGGAFNQQNVFHLAAPTSPYVQTQIAEKTAFRGQMAQRRN